MKYILLNLEKIFINNSTISNMNVYYKPFIIKNKRFIVVYDKFCYENNEEERIYEIVHSSILSLFI